MSRNINLLLRPYSPLERYLNAIHTLFRLLLLGGLLFPPIHLSLQLVDDSIMMDVSSMAIRLASLYLMAVHYRKARGFEIFKFNHIASHKLRTEAAQQLATYRTASELKFWILLQIFLMAGLWPLFVAYLPTGLTVAFSESAGKNPGQALFSMLLIVFLVAFRTAFGSLPLKWARKSRVPPFAEPLDAEPGTGIDELDEEIAAEDVSPMVVLSRQVTASAELASRFFWRSGLYMVVGVTVAFSGIGFFYLQSFPHPETTVSTAEPTNAATERQVFISLAEMTPRIGILVFLELVAWYFFRQYRVAMDEFRYFEAILRHRQEVYSLIRLKQQHEPNFDVMELVKINQFYSGAGRLEKEQSTELLEARKLEGQHIKIIEKAIEEISKIAQSRT